MDLCLMHRQLTVLIAAVSPEGILAIDGQMPWHQPKDLKRFKRLTTNNILIYGRKTFDSFNRKPLPGRKNFIISKTLDAAYDNDNNYVSLFYDLEGALSTAKLEYPDKTIYIGGGASIYEQTLPIVDKIELTIINKDQVCYHEGERTMFPNWLFSLNDFEEEARVVVDTCHYVTYKRKPISYINKVRSLFL